MPKDKDSFTKAFAALGLNAQESLSLPAKLVASTLGISQEDENGLFILNQTNKMSDVIPAVNGAYIAFLEEFAPYDPLKFEEEKNEFSKQLISEKKENAFKDFMEDLKVKSGLKTYTFKEFRQ